VQAHANDLRAEVNDHTLVQAVMDDYRVAELDAPTRLLLDYAVKLTRQPAAISEVDVQQLRHAGLSDRAIHDAAQVTAYFNYINRVADGLGVDLEPDMPPKPG
jgi:uncharacterized peroxidase-related enzyme